MLDWLVVDQVMRYSGFDPPAQEKQLKIIIPLLIIPFISYFLSSHRLTRLTVWCQWEIKFRHLDEL